VIAVTRLDGDQVLVNDDLIETVEHTPDTLISLTNGTKLFVRESPDEVLDRIVAFRRSVLRGPGRQAVPGVHE
jgi:flagellar protein FlbD